MRGGLATLLALAWLLGVGPLQGVYSQQYAPPSESECRPYIERALKEQGSPDTPPASIEDTGSSEETAGPEIPLNEQTDPEAATAETAPESDEVNSAENVGEVTSGEADEPTLERETRSLDETASSDGVDSLEQVEVPTTEADSVESAESLEQTAETPAIEEASTESAESTEQAETPAAEEASTESAEQGEVPAADEASIESAESVEQGDNASAESAEQGETAEDTGSASTESAEAPAASLSEEEQQASPIESTEADLTSSESLEQDVAPIESAESSESVEQDATPVEISESTEETVPAESLESVEQDAAPIESAESLEETVPAESSESVEQDATPIESVESLEETVPAESVESVEQDAAPTESSESLEETVPAESTESLEQDATPIETTESTESTESLEETTPSESSESLENEPTPVESAESLEEIVPAESLESLEEGATPTESAESSESSEPTAEAASQEQASAESVESTEQITEGGEAVSEEAVISEEQVVQEETAAEEPVLSRERRSLDEEDGASSEEKTEEGSVEALPSSESLESSETTTEEPVAEQQVADETEATPVVDEEQAELDQETSQEAPTAGEAAPAEVDEEEREVMPEEELSFDVDIPDNLRPRDHIAQILKLDETSVEDEMLVQKVEESTLKELKRLYDNAIKPLEILYKYRDLSNRHFGDPEIFSKPLILFMGPWSGGKSTIINYLLDNEYTRTTLRTGAEPSPAYFNLLMWGEREEVLDGTQLAADWTFSGLQKFGQGLLDRLRGLRLKNRLLEKVNIVEIPGILEIRKQVERLFPFNDACQWFIDRADIIFLVYDPSKLDVGPETEAILDQLKGREYQTRIVLNKADQVRPEELMRVQGTLIWNISPLMSSSQPPVMYSTSLWSMPYEAGAPLRLLRAQERAFLRDMREAIDKRVENKIASARRFAVRVRNHAKMVDCYLTTYYNHKSFFGNRKKISDDIIERPQDYHIYEGLSTLTNISRYDLPDPETYRDFFQLNPLYEFQQLAATCTYFKGCPINRLDVAIAYDLPELVGKYKKSAEIALEKRDPTKS